MAVDTRWNPPDRQWTDDDGQHMLVMVAGGQIYELIFKGGEGRWYIAKVRPDRTVHINP